MKRLTTLKVVVFKFLLFVKWNLIKIIKYELMI